MFSFQIIDNKIQWEQLLNSIKEVDIYYSFEYCNSFADKENGVPLAAYYQNNSTKIFYPFIKRKVDWKQEVLFDIVTPYGYGGPLIEGSFDALNLFYECFKFFCRENNIITETIRFHPIYKNHEYCKKIIDAQYIRKTAGVDLTMPLEKIREMYSSMNKRNIKKANNAGLFCYSAENTLKNIHIFMELYRETMDRNRADSYYYFDEKYFMDVMKETNISKSYLLFVQYKEEIIAAVMVLVGDSISHYHLGASKTEYLPLKPNNLLFDFMIEFCKVKGSRFLHLGGGYQENDGLFKFKSSFCNHNHFEFFIGKRIYDQNKYHEITQEVRKFYKVNENYFPIYRGKKELLIMSEK